MEIIEHPDRQFWWDVCSSCDHATFLQSPLWTELACLSYDNLRSATVGAVLESGTRVVLPLVEAPAAWGTMRALESTWNWSPGGVIADGPVEADDIRALYGSLRSWRLGECVFTGNPHSPLPDPPLWEGWNVQEDFSQVLFLDSDLDTIVSRYSLGHRQSLKKGLKAGVTVRTASSIDDFRTHYRAYEDSYDRWTARWAPPLPWRLFENCYHLSVKYPENIRLWMAEIDGRFAAGAITLYWKRSLVGWHGAAYRELFKYCANHVLHTEISRDALDRGLAFYDFNPSGGQEGVVKFKAGFRTEKKVFPRMTYSSRFLSAMRWVGRRTQR